MKYDMMCQGLPTPDWPLEKVIERLVKFKLEPIIWNYRLGVFISEFSSTSVNVYCGKEDKIYIVNKNECKQYRPSQKTIEALRYFYDQIKQGKSCFTTHCLSDDVLEFEKRFCVGVKNMQRKISRILNILVCVGILYSPKQIGSGFNNSDVGGKVIYEYRVRFR